MDKYPELPIVVTVITEAQRSAYDALSFKRVCQIGRERGHCNVRLPRHGKGGHDGIEDAPAFAFHECEEHRVWVFWR